MTILKNILEEYKADSMTDSEEMYRLKKRIERLSETDRALLITYADTKSMAKTAAIFKVSVSIIYRNIKRIRELLKNDY